MTHPHFVISSEKIAGLTNGKIYGKYSNVTISSITTDSRQTMQESLFVALKGNKYNGNDFIGDAFNRGAKIALVAIDEVDAVSEFMTEYCIIAVESPLIALGILGRFVRHNFSGQVLTITGSNGKTIVKNCIFHICSKQKNSPLTCDVSPGSYNSRLGVPLSIFSMSLETDLWINEAGVSQQGDMSYLEPILKPDFGVLTNIGFAHIAGFGSREKIALEKMKLFENIPSTGWVVLPGDEPLIEPHLKNLSCKIYLTGRKDKGELPYIYEYFHVPGGLKAGFAFPNGEKYNVFINTPSLDILKDIEMSVIVVFLLGTSPQNIISSLKGYETGGTRMEIWHSPGGITLINDTCSSDPISVESALRSLESISQSGKKIFIFGGMGELGDITGAKHRYIGELASHHKVHLLMIPKSENLNETAKGFLHGLPEENHFQTEKKVIYYDSTLKLSSSLRNYVEPGDTILFKGPRGSSIPEVARELLDAIAPNRMIVDFSIILENLAAFRQRVGEKVKILAMVKALGYGSDMTRLALDLEKAGVEYLGVSTPDEGVQLRKTGTTLPILVMITTPEEILKVINNSLTPVINSIEQAKNIIEIGKEHTKDYNVHLKIDTGMGRMGVSPDKFKELVQIVVDSKVLKITGLMTHFGVADSGEFDDYTHKQISVFRESLNYLKKSCPDCDLVAHAAATSGAIRFKESHFDMVRIGLGLYGLYPGKKVMDDMILTPAVALVSRIVDIKYHKKGDRLGYGGSFHVPCDNFRSALLPIGYNDGIPWSLSNKGQFMINGILAPVIGRVSMDSLMLDITDIPEAHQGSDVLIWGSYQGYTLRPETVSEAAGTIVYEILTRVGPRVQRIFKGE